MDFVLANNADPDEMPHNAAFYLRAHFIIVPVLGFPVLKGLKGSGYSLIIRKFSASCLVFSDPCGN